MDNLANRYKNPITPHAEWVTCPLCNRLVPRTINPVPDDSGAIVQACFLCWVERVLDQEDSAPNSTPTDGSQDIDFPAIEREMWWPFEDTEADYPPPGDDSDVSYDDVE